MESPERNTFMFYKVPALPALLCLSESWTVTALQGEGIEVTEMRFLGAVAERRLLDKKGNGHIRQECQFTSLFVIYICLVLVGWD